MLLELDQALREGALRARCEDAQRAVWPQVHQLMQEGPRDERVEAFAPRFCAGLCTDQDSVEIEEHCQAPAYLIQWRHRALQQLFASGRSRVSCQGSGTQQCAV